MRRLLRLLIAMTAVLLLGLAGLALIRALQSDSTTGPAELQSRVTWPWPVWWPGGLSGLAMSEHGAQLLAVSDDNYLVRARIRRDAAGGIETIRYLGYQYLVSPRWWRGPFYSDSEGLAVAADGTLVVAYEGWNRVVRFDPGGAYLDTLPLPPLAFDQQQSPNEGLEAIAVTAAGAVLVVPEIWAPENAADQSRPLLRFAAGEWTVQASIETGAFRPVGLDLDDAGRLYLLEREFHWSRGFSSRIRRFELTDDGLGPPELLLQTRPGQFGNFEGLSVWRRGDGGLVLTLVSDNNRNPLLRREIVEFRLPE